MTKHEPKAPFSQFAPSLLEILRSHVRLKKKLAAPSKFHSVEAIVTLSTERIDPVRRRSPFDRLRAINPSNRTKPTDKDIHHH